MPRPIPTDEQLLSVVAAIREHPTKQQAADALDMPVTTVKDWERRAAKRGLLGFDSVLPGFRITGTSETRDADGNLTSQSIRQAEDRTGEAWAVPEGHAVKAESALVSGDGQLIQRWVKTAADAEYREAAFRAVVEGFKEDLPRAAPISPPDKTLDNLASQYTITDAHIGSLAWREETGVDYDTAEAERLLTRFFGAAIDMSPPSDTAILCQLGDFLHYDGFRSVTPEHGNLLDSDTRFPKVVRAAIRVTRWTIARLLEKHKHVHVIMADANHDPASGVWLRELLAAFYEEEPRLTVDTSGASYYCFEWGETALFYHHGHRTKPDKADKVFASDFREVYGRSKHAYAHLGHRHKDGMDNTTLMKVEEHETLAGRDAFAAHGGWRSGRSAKVIHYHKRFGEVSRNIITPEMLAE